MVVSNKGPQALLDLLLAQHAISGVLRGERLRRSREVRDRLWIISALGCRGIFAAGADVEACLRGQAGRFLPGTEPHRLVRGMRVVIDRIDAWADIAATPSVERLLELATKGGLGGDEGGRLRRGQPDDAMSGVRHPDAAELGARIACIGKKDGVLLERMHPVTQAAELLESVRLLSPLTTDNFLLASLAASLLLLGNGYPPFMPQPTQLAEFERFCANPRLGLGDAFGRVVFEGYREFSTE